MCTYICTGNSVSATSSGLDDPPTNLTAMTLSSTSIRVTWGPPAIADAHKIVMYNVSYDSLVYEISILTNDTTIELDNLEEGTEYLITIEAVYDGITCGSAQANATTLAGT